MVDKDPHFTQDWWSHNIPVWKEIVLPRLPARPNHILEIGCFEGMATKWMAENIATDNKDRIIVVDTFEGSPEHESMGVRTDDLLEKFQHNLDIHKDKIMIFKGLSGVMLRSTIFSKIGFDLIYVDGSHVASDVLEDAVLAWRTLNYNGIMVFDDYGWDGGKDELDRPAIAIDLFKAIYSRQMEVLHEGYQVIVQKKLRLI